MGKYNFIVAQDFPGMKFDGGCDVHEGKAFTVEIRKTIWR